MKTQNTCLALDIGATNIKYALVNSDEQMSELMIAKTQKDAGPEGLVNQIAEIYNTMRSRFEQSESLMPAIGLCAAGPLDPVQGKLLEPANLTDGTDRWKNFDLVGQLKKRLNVTVVLENDAAAAAWAEFWVGEGRHVDDLVTLAFGTGLGVGVIRSGKLLRTPGNLHPELGHSIVAMGAGKTSGAKIEGSLESIIGPKFFLENFSYLKKEPVDGKTFVELYKAGDTLAVEQAEIFFQTLLAGMFNFYLAFAPEIFIFQGGFTPLLELLKTRLHEALAQKVKGFNRPGGSPPQIAVSKISRTCGVYGAAYGVFKSIS